MALVLARKVWEEIVIGEPGPDQIIVQVASIRGGRVHLSIHAGKHVPIRRAELDLRSPSGGDTLGE